MKDIKRNEIESERELTGCGGVATVLSRKINISYFLFFINIPALSCGVLLCGIFRQQPNKISCWRNVVLINANLKSPKWPKIGHNC